MKNDVFVWEMILRNEMNCKAEQRPLKREADTYDESQPERIATRRTRSLWSKFECAAISANSV